MTSGWKAATVLLFLGVSALPAAAQPADLLERAVGVRVAERLAPLTAEILDNDVTPAGLQAVFQANANLFVAVVETLLQEDDLLPAERAPQGILTRRVIDAMIQFCGRRGIEAQCMAAPLSDQTMLAIGGIVAARRDTLVAGAPTRSPAPADRSPAPADKPAEPAVAEPAAEMPPAPPPITSTTDQLAPGWVIRRTAALTVETIPLDGDAYEIAFSGTTETRDYVAVFPAELATAATGQVWETTVMGRVVDEAAPEVRLRGQLVGATGSYLGELHPGEIIPVAPDLTEVAQSGTIDRPEVEGIRPYIQFWHNPGEQLDFSIVVTLPRIEAVPTAGQPASNG